MTEDMFLRLRGQSNQVNRIRREDRDDTSAVPQFTPPRMRDWLACAVEPWRMYGAHKPDDMPPKNGRPMALQRLLAECGEVIE